MKRHRRIEAEGIRVACSAFSLVVVPVALIVVAPSAVAGPELLERALATIQRGDIPQGAVQLKAAYLDIVLMSCRGAQQRLKSTPESAESVCRCTVEAAAKAFSEDRWRKEASAVRAVKQFDPMPTLKDLMGSSPVCGSMTEAAVRPAASPLLVEGSAAFRQGNFRAAVEKFGAAHKLLVELHGQTHSEVVNAAVLLGSALQAAGRSTEAVQTLRSALATQRTLLGERHVDLVPVTSLLASALFSARQFDEALPLAEASLGLSREMLGAQHDATTSNMQLLALLYRSKGRTGDALVLQQQLLRRFESTQNAAATLRMSREVVESMLALGRDAEAMPLLERTVLPTLASEGAIAPVDAIDLRRLASLYEAAGRDPDAKRLREALARRGERPAP